MNKKVSITVIILLITLLSSGCVPRYDNNITQTVNDTQSLSTTITMPPHSEDSIIASKTDLAQRLNINIEEINILFVKAVTWSDTGLGCPQENMEYAQVLTEGYQILLEAVDKVFEYHTDNNNNIILCASAPSTEITIPNEDNTVEDGDSIQPKDPVMIITIPTKPNDDTSFEDGGPNQPKDTDVVITTPIKTNDDASFEDGGPNQPKDTDVVITITTPVK